MCVFFLVLTKGYHFFNQENELECLSSDLRWFEQGVINMYPSILLGLSLKTFFVIQFMHAGGGAGGWDDACQGT